MKKKILFPLSILSILALTGCSTVLHGQKSESSSSSITNEEVSGTTTDIDIADDTVTSDFSLKNESGTSIVGNEAGIYTISAGGEYTASGKLNGEIYIEASGQEVTLVLDGVSITNDLVSPIYVSNCSDFNLKVPNNTTSYIYDTRTTDYSTSDTAGRGAIHVENGDLKIKGKGTLSIESTCNSGIHCKDNVSIKNVTMLIKAMNNGVRGNDKIVIEEDPTIGIVAGNNGLVTHNSDKGTNAQHGYIYITGGTITINSYGDAIDAAYAVEISNGTDSDGNTYTPVLDLYTNKYSSYTLATTSTGSNSLFSRGGPGGGNPPGGGGFGGGGFQGGSSAEKADDSAKGIKAPEAINISGGTIFTYTYDDGLHTNADKLDTGVTGSANINISGGTLSIKASDDGIHADKTLNITDGVIYVAESHEGIEANIINISGGELKVNGSDDGVNASNQINISGGRLDVTVSPNGDTDGIDSNGSITITGGTIITRGPNSEMASPLDADGTIKIAGGTTIIVGYANGRYTTSNVTKSTSSNGLSTGDHTVTLDGATITYNNTYTYSGSVTVYGSGSATVK